MPGTEGDESFFADGIDVAQIIAQLQAQIQQLQSMLNNASIPAPARQQAQLKHQQLHLPRQVRRKKKSGPVLLASTST